MEPQNTSNKKRTITFALLAVILIVLSVVAYQLVAARTNVSKPKVAISKATPKDRIEK